MEETVRAMLAYKKQAEQLRQEKAALTLAFEVYNSSISLGCRLKNVGSFLRVITS